MKESMTREQKAALAQHLKDAWATRDHGGMAALAAVMDEIMEGYVASRSIVTEILEQHDVPPGVTPEYDVPDEMTAYYIAFGAGVTHSPLKANKTRPEIGRVHCAPLMDRSVFEHGDVGTLASKLTEAGDAIIKAENAYLASLLATAILALGATNNVSISGGALTMDGLSEAIGLLEDTGNRCASILTRGQHLEKFQASNSPLFSDDRALKGAVDNYHGAVVYNVKEMAATQVILLPDRYVGKYPMLADIRSEVKTAGFSTEMLVWKEVGYSLLLAKYCAMVTITP